MARPLRIEFPGAYYHVTSRGNERKAIFREDADRGKSLEVLSSSAEQFRVRIHTYVLMDNHYHLLVETPDEGLSRAARYLNGVYTQYVNRRYRRVGYLLQGRYKAILIDKDSYLIERSRYIHLNPWRVTSGVKDPFHYRWSSLRVVRVYHRILQVSVGNTQGRIVKIDLQRV
ncbi:MAG: transposase [Rhodospirillales bacterium]